MHRATLGTACLIALLLAACSRSNPAIERLEGAEPQRLSFGSPDKVQGAFIKQMQACWFAGQEAPLSGFQYDLKPAIMDTGSGQVPLRQVTIRSEGQEKSFVIQFFPFNDNTLISTRNLKLPLELAARLKRDVETWIFEQSGCGGGQLSSQISGASSAQPQTGAGSGIKGGNTGWGAKQEQTPGALYAY